MTAARLIFRSLCFYARAHLGALLGAAVGSTVLIGALAVGSSVRGTLRELALTRLGKVELALASGERLFRAQLALDLRMGLRQAGLGIPNSPPVAAALQLPAVATTGDDSARANHVQVLGVDHWFWSLSRQVPPFMGFAAKPAVAWDLVSAPNPIPPGAVVLNEPLANQLRVKVGQDVLLRVQRPSQLSADAPLAPEEHATTALRLRVQAIVTDQQAGRFSLQASQVAPLNAFVALPYLQERLGVPNRANLLLVGQVPPLPPPAVSPAVGYVSVARPPIDLLPVLTNLLQQRWDLADAELELRELPQWRAFELRSRRVFLEAPVGEAALGALSNLVTRSRPAQAARPQPAAGPITPGRPAPVIGPPTVNTARPPPGQVAPRVPVAPAPQPAGPGYPAAVQQFAGLLNLKPGGVVTYLVSELRLGERSTPYSMVAAIGPPVTPPELRDDEILINQWLAEDLGAQPGDELTLTYYVVGRLRQLEERTASFRVRGVFPMQAPGVDRELMPDFPGLAAAQSCRDWDAGLPIKTERIRDKDEQYWRLYRGQPKALITLAAGQKLWRNRFGDLTGVRYYTAGGALPSAPMNPAATPPSYQLSQLASQKAALARLLLSNLSPSAVGLQFQPVRAQALAASAQGQDFGQLFLGFSGFLVVAAMLLMGLLFQFGIEQRATEAGTLLALGFAPRQVRRLLLLEGAALALLGAVLGTADGAWYARAMLHGLSTVWREAVGGSPLRYFADARTLAVGIAAALLLVCLTMWLALWRQTRQPVQELLAEGALAGSGQRTASPQSARKWTLAALLIGVLALALVGWALGGAQGNSAGLFFAAGGLLLAAGLAGCAAGLARLSNSDAASRLSFTALGLRSVTRRRGRSLATVALLAGGTFLVAAIGVFRLEATRDARKRSSGTGGFAFIGESTQPVIHDLNSAKGRAAYGLETADLAGVAVVPFRVRDGEEASCLNLNRAQTPRLLGVAPELLQQRGAFTFVRVAPGLPKDRPWLLLRRQPGAAAVPAIGDQASILWALGKKVGDVIAYTDERGRTFKLRLVGALANSILQGNLVIGEDEFVARFPSTAGYRFFLIDAPAESAGQVSKTLTRALRDLGLELSPAVDRLAAFNAVQNTYLGTFQLLGGLGLVLGSAGLGAVVLRNVLERRGELALLLAVGFEPGALRRLVLAEHTGLLAAGLALGIGAAAAAVLPSLLSPGARVPFGSLALTLAAVLANGVLWTWLATVAALRGNLLAALRNE
jgi:ABC-type antimicrobial peptide transport system permease subunit